jgi:hypothetical protein
VTVRVGQDTRAWPVVAGRFKALVPLAPGCNDMTFATTGASAEFALTYAPQTNPRRVRPVYIITADGDGSFDAAPGEANDVASAVARIRLAARLMQTFTAEKMQVQGQGRRTFRLETDAAGVPVVQVFRSDLTTAQAYAMDAGALWGHFYGELGLGNGDDVKVIAIMGMSHYDAATGTLLAHGALGGGHLAMFGGTGLHTWATSLDDLVAHLSDTTFIDTSVLSDDSAGRGTYWANFSTGIGAAMHELGHTLSLPHPADGLTTMGRGLDHFNRAFMLSEPYSSAGPGLDVIQPSDEVGWDRSDVIRLRYHRFLALDDRTYQVNQPPGLTLDATSLRIDTAARVRGILYLVDGVGVSHDELLSSAPTSKVFTFDALRARFPGATRVTVSVVDGDGNFGDIDVFL